MNTYAVISNTITNKTTRVLSRKGKISVRQCTDSIKRISDGQNHRFALRSDSNLKVLGSTLLITPNGVVIDNVDHIIQNSQKRYTVVYRLTEVGRNDIRVNYGVALTSPRDNYSRKLGRTIATGRLNSTTPVSHTGSMRLSCNIPSNGQQWHNLEQLIMQDVERKFRRNG